MSIRHIFADNLKNLIGRNGSVSDVSRKLEINRTQLIRYTTGESFPGPDILVKLCDFFDVPLTIIKISIADIEAAKTTQGLPSGFANCFEPAQKSAFPNGFYSEYTYCNSALGQFQHCIGHAATIQDRRIFSIYAPNRNLIGKNLATQRQPKRKFIGYAFQIEMKYITYKNKFKIKEIPIIFTDRLFGDSKLSKGIISEAIFGVLQMRLKNFSLNAV